jgi:TRAP-type C4-dicarboxylate transport system permease small subunit
MGGNLWANGAFFGAIRYIYITLEYKEEMMYERGAIMLAHSAMIGIVVYMMMRYVFNQSPFVAEDRSIVIAAFVLIYMVMFGHGMPTQLNKNLSFIG